MLIKNYNKIISNGENSEIKKQREDILDILTNTINNFDPYKIVKKLIKKNQIVIDNHIVNITHCDGSSKRIKNHSCAVKQQLILTSHHVGPCNKHFVVSSTGGNHSFSLQYLPCIIG